MGLGLPALVWSQTASLGGGVPLHKKPLKKSVAQKLVGRVPEGSQSAWPCTAPMPLFEPNLIHSLCSCLCVRDAR
jgi:hypothetical protein